MKRSVSRPGEMSTPLERVNRTQSKVRELRVMLEKMRGAANAQQASLARLAEARRRNMPLAELDKAIRQMVASLMLFEGLGTTIADTFSEFEQPLVELMKDVSRKLHDREQLAALSQTAQALNSSLDLEEVLRQAMTLLVELTGAERAFLMLREPDGREMQIKASHNIDAAAVSATDFAISRSIIEQVRKSRSAIVTTNAAADPRFSEKESIALHSLRSIVCVPLILQADVMGVIYLDNRIQSDTFSEADRDFASAFAAHLAVALENARLFERVTVARNLMRNVFESIPNAVIATDERGLITLVNASAARILGPDAERALHRGYAHLAPILDGTLSLLLDEVFDLRAPAARELIEGVLADGREVRLSATAAPLVDTAGESVGAVMVVEDRTESMRFARERAMVRRYLPSQLVDSFAASDEQQLGGARQLVSVLFADLRGFTTFSEARDPVEVVELLNACFGVASDAIRAHGGIVDKYMGDAVMAHFNSPLHPQEDHAWLAVLTAWEIRAALAAERERRPDAAWLRMGIGVTSGHALAGNVGGSERMEYTLIGDTVNLAKRLQENAAPDQILVSAATFEAVRDRVSARRVAPLELKGRSTPEVVYELTALLA